MVEQPAHGTLSGTAPQLVYTPDRSYLGTDAIEFRVSDGTLDSVVAVIAIEVVAGSADGRSEHRQVVVLHQHHGVVGRVGHDCVGEAAVDLAVRSPALAPEGIQVRIAGEVEQPVVHEPEHLVGDDVVVAVELVGRDVDEVDRVAVDGGKVLRSGLAVRR